MIKELLAIADKISEANSRLQNAVNLKNLALTKEVDILQHQAYNAIHNLIQKNEKRKKRK